MGEMRRAADAYPKWIEWSEADQSYLGKCPDVITGIHSDDPVQLYAKLCEVVEEVLAHLLSENRPLPRPACALCRSFITITSIVSE